MEPQRQSKARPHTNPQACICERRQLRVRWPDEDSLPEQEEAEQDDCLSHQLFHQRHPVSLLQKLMSAMGPKQTLGRCLQRVESGH
jgi:hypothetical protein